MLGGMGAGFRPHGRCLLYLLDAQLFHLGLETIGDLKDRLRASASHVEEPKLCGIVGFVVLDTSLPRALAIGIALGLGFHTHQKIIA